MAYIEGTTAAEYRNMLKRFYSSNRNAQNSKARTTYSNSQLVSADSDALKKVCESLKKLSYEKDNGPAIYNHSKAFVTAYNNLLESSGKCTESSSELERTLKKCKEFVKENKDALEALGFSVTSSGKLSLDDDKILKTSAKKLERMFASDNDFTSTIGKFAKKFKSISKQLIQMDDAKKNKLEDLPVSTANIMTSTNIDFLA